MYADVERRNGCLDFARRDTGAAKRVSAVHRYARLDVAHARVDEVFDDARKRDSIGTQRVQLPALAAGERSEERGKRERRKSAEKSAATTTARAFILLRFILLLLLVLLLLSVLLLLVTLLLRSIRL